METKEAIGVSGVLTITLRNIKTGEVERHVIKNLNPTVGRTMLANNLASASPTNTPKITHVALGTGTTAPANVDTKLQTETYRNTIASLTNSSNIVYATGFYTAGEVNGTFREVGLFSNGTGSADSGVIISHVAVNITKTNVQTLTLDWAITIA